MTARRLSFTVSTGCVVVFGAAGATVAQRSASDRKTASAGVVTATWIGPTTGGLWSDPANWDTADFPNNGNGGLNYNVSITSSVSDPTVINLDTDVVIESLFQRAKLDAQSGPANLTINGPWDWQGVILGPEPQGPTEESRTRPSPSRPRSAADASSKTRDWQP